MQVVTVDKRVFLGTLMCIDHFGNLLLYEAVEEVQTGAKVHRRILNQIIISLDKMKAVSVLVRLPSRPRRHTLSSFHSGQGTFFLPQCI